jgi:hypothetical protein
MRRELLAAAVAWCVASPVISSAEEPVVPATDNEVPRLSLPSPLGAVTYTPGRGVRVGETGVTIGGYTGVHVVRDEGGPANFSLEELSFFLTWDPTPRFHLFSELEFEDLIYVDDHGRRRDPRFVTERLHGDVAVADWLSVRGGKFLTPVGRWNVIHAQPLVWTTSRPLVTRVPFDPHTTGVMLFGSLFPRTGGLTYSLYGQFTDHIDPIRTPQTADRSGGARLEYSILGGWSVGGSYLAFTDADRWHHLSGADTLWQRGGLELMGEFAFEEVEEGPDAQSGLYLQAVQELRPKLYVVGRYEHFDPPRRRPEVNLVVLGVAYKPWPYVVIKGEYLVADHRSEESPPGFKTSLAILF